MNDPEILRHIEDLVNEEHQLTQQSHRGGLSEDEHKRMRQLEISLDQCWDLLRQRRALRSAHLNPDEAAVRDA
ncbi:MAG TPA: DUF2630 family protein, partial [Ktedonobacteraceae bacterium]